MAQKDANLIDESQVKAASGNKFIRFYGEDLELEQPASEDVLNTLPEISFFGISREHPLDGKKCLPQAVASGKIGTCNRVELQAQPGEYLVFQIVVWSREKTFQIVNCSLPEKREFCFFAQNGIDFQGNVFHHNVQVEQQESGIFWFGLQVGEDEPEIIQSTITFQTDHCGEFHIPLTIHVSGDVLNDGGENDDFRMARLKWLNSAIGLEDEVPMPYQPLRREGNTLYLTGHAVEIGSNGLPAKILSGYDSMNTTVAAPVKNLLDGAITLTAGGCTSEQGKLEFYDESPCEISWRITDGSGDQAVRLCVGGKIRFDGMIQLHFQTVSPDDEETEVNLHIPFADAPYMLGLGVKRPCIPPEKLDWHWDPRKWEDSFWAGTVNNGCIVRLTEESVSVPLLNCYYDWSPLIPPACWYSAGKGGITLNRNGNKLNVLCYSSFAKTQSYGVEFRLTPFHPIDYKTHWNTRFFHPHMHSFELKEDDCFTNPDFAALRAKGVNCLNVHHAISLNPIINYPFSEKSLPLLQKFVAKAHEEGFKVLLYYTVRELTVHAPEFKALYALKGEIFFPWQDNGKWPVTTPAEGPDSWFKDHLDYGFLPAWTEVIKSGPLHGIPDRSLITTPRSRLENFYLEGLRFLLERCPIDGLYLDDCDLSDLGMIRLKRIFRKYRGADPIMDFHAWESFNSAYCVPLRDAERFPCLTRLWLGEGVKYDLESYENWLIRLSGLPFGLTSEMLGKGNPYLGLLFGMTNRYGWGGEPCELWKIFDRFGISEAVMTPDVISHDLGTDVPEVHVTLWRKANGAAMLAIASWSEKEETVHLKLPEALCGKTMIQPPVAGFQDAAEYATGTSLPIQPKQGLLLLFQ